MFFGYKGSYDTNNEYTLSITWPTVSSQYGRMVGYVYDLSNNYPIKGAKVSLIYNLFAITDSNGYYKIENIPAGTYTVQVEAQGFQTKTELITVNANQTIQKNFYLTSSTINQPYFKIYVDRGCNSNYKIGDQIIIYGESNITTNATLYSYWSDGTIKTYTVQFNANQKVSLYSTTLAGVTGTRIYKTKVTYNGKTYESNECMINIISQSTKPSPPRNLSLSIEYDSSNNKYGIRLSWDKPLSDGGSPIIKYEMYKKVENGTFFLLGPRDAQYTYFRDWDNIQVGKTYYYYVIAVNSNGKSDPSNTAYIIVTSQTTNVILTLYILENSLTGSPLPGVSVAVTDGGGNTFSGVTNSNGYLSFTGVPGMWSFTAMKSGYNTKSWSDTITSTCTKYQYLTISASPVGTIDIFANLNGQPWTGPISYKLTGPEIYNGNNVPQILTNKPTGIYTITYISGGPSNATLQSITPSNTQTLTNGGIIIFTLNFISQTSITKPSPPRNLRVTSVGDKVVNLAWDPPSSNGGSEITNYKIYRGTCSGCETLYITISSSYTTFQNIGANVVNGTTYYYYVTAINSVGESSPSNEVYATPQSSATKPSPPQNLNAEIVYDSSNRKAGVRISWNPPSNNGGSNIIKYNIYRKEENGSYICIGPRDAQYTYFRDWDIKLGKKYYYKVTAIKLYW